MDESGRVGHRSEDSSLHLDHFQGCRMVARVGGGGAIRENEAFVTTIICLSHGGMDANVCRDPAEDYISDASSPEKHIKIGSVE